MPTENPSMFPSGHYVIRDERLAEHREVMISADGGPAPHLGDLFTIVREALVHDLMVLDVLQAGSDWTARCRVIGVA